VLEFLKKAGKWTLLIGTTIGTSLATEMIMKANGTKA
jgi:hypothetical protein